MTNLEFFSASRNVLFSGTIPSSIGALTNLAYFGISNTGIFDVIPSETTLLTKLAILGMTDTQLSGSLPNELSKLTNLETLSIANNKFSGTVPSLANCTRLSFLNLGSNEFQGRLPALPASVNWTGFDGNRFTGPLPTNFPQLTKLTLFSAGRNQLTGTLPELSTLTALKHLLLGLNRFNGTIPDLSSLFAAATAPASPTPCLAPTAGKLNALVAPSAARKRRRLYPPLTVLAFQPFVSNSRDYFSRSQ
jgi:Leucine-rich repeat (LRR) protein